jgi:NAD(P)-dependent dehydrogenase (short-subunit alcohol dehydrogenase family)
MSTQLPLSGRLAVVTGATRGIGRCSALALAGAGAHVIAASRTQGALEALDDDILALSGERATLVPLNLQNGDGVDQLGRAVYDRWGRLDILVHAAGLLGGLTLASHQDVRVWERVLQVNLTASFRLIRSFEPLLNVSDAGRAIFLTSRVAVDHRAFWSAYAASKAGMEALVDCWAQETDETALRTVLLDPGAMRTKMRAEAFPGEDPDSLPPPEEIGPLVVQLARPDLVPERRVAFRAWKAAQPA